MDPLKKWRNFCWIVPGQFYTSRPIYLPHHMRMGTPRPYTFPKHKPSLYPSHQPNFYSSNSALLLFILLPMLLSPPLLILLLLLLLFHFPLLQAMWRTSATCTTIDEWPSSDHRSLKLTKFIYSRSRLMLY